MSINLIYQPKFLRQLKKIDPHLRSEVLIKIEEFQDKKNHKSLNVHPLKGRLKKYHSFRVNYSVRILFVYINETTAVLSLVGEHDIYKNLQ